MTNNLSKPGLNFRAMRMFSRDPYNFQRTNAELYGDPFVLEVPFRGSYYFTGHPEAIQAIFTAGPDVFSQGSARIFTGLVGKYSMLHLDGETHARHRKLLTPPFHGKRMVVYGDIFRELALQQTASWQEQGVINTQREMEGFSIRVIVRAVLGLVDSDEQARAIELLSNLVHAIKPHIFLSTFFRINLGPLSAWGRYVILLRQVDEFLFALLEKRKHEGVDETRQDILSLMMLARDEAGEPLSPQEIRDEILTLLVAGHETTATSLVWNFYELVKNPDMAGRIREELPSDASPETVSTDAYMTAFVNEAFRHHPVIADYLRQLKRPWSLMGHELPAGAFLLPCPYLAHHNPNVFEQPDEFQPQRFLDNKFGPYEFFPFSGGRRRCIGAAFAPYQMKIMLHAALSQFDLEEVEVEPAFAARRNLTVGIKGGLDIRVRRRG